MHVYSETRFLYNSKRVLHITRTHGKSETPLPRPRVKIKEHVEMSLS